MWDGALRVLTGDTSLGRGFYEFTYWFRIATLAIVVLFMLFGVSETSPAIIIFMLLYNALLRIFRKKLHLLNHKYPALIVADAIIAFLSIALTGGYRSSFQLYTLSPVISGSNLFGFKGAVLLLSLIHISEPTRPY
jgi:hypothetical protein